MSKSLTSPSFARRRPPSWEASAREVIRRLFALCAAALVLLGALTAGRTYLWCSMVQQRVESCCCDPERSELDAPPGAQSEIKNGCCEDRRAGGVDVVGVASEIVHVAAALPAAAPAPAPALPTILLTAASSRPNSPWLLTRARPARAGPLRASDRCAKLQVFRC